MSISAILVDFDDKIVYDIYGGRPLWWMLTALSGHRIMIDHDDNAGDTCSIEEKLKGLGYIFKECKAISMPNEFKDMEIDNETNFYSIRLNIITLGRAINCYLWALRNQYTRQLEEFKLENGIDEQTLNCWYKCNSLKDLYEKSAALYDTEYVRYQASNIANRLVIPLILEQTFIKRKEGDKE